MVPVLLALLGLAAGAPQAHAKGFSIYQQALGTLSLAFTGGFQYWTLEGLEESLEIRNGVYEDQGFSFETADYGPTYAFGAELQVRLTQHWFVRTQAEWTRLSWEDRDRQFLLFLSGRERTPVSLGYKAKVESRPLIFALGAGRSFRTESVRWGLSANWIIAPIKVVDELQMYLGTETLFEVESTGVGNGLETALSVDYFTDSNLNLFVEGFWRTGGTDVDIRTEEWASTILPSRRRVDLDGAGIRLGFRWI
jgi:hypothetical protein